MKQRDRVLAWIGIGVLILMGARFQQVQLPEKNRFRLKPISLDPIEKAERKIDKVRKLLPPHGKVGFLCIIPKTEGQTGNELTFGALRYTITPCQAVDSPDEDIVVGCFNTPWEADSAAKHTGLRVTEDLHNGVYLMNREEK